MICACPHCGYFLSSCLNNGIAFCSHCNQVFESSVYNQLLSAFWLVKKEHLSLDKLKWYIKDDDLAVFVFSFAAENNYGQGEFVRVLKKLEINKK